MKSDLRYAARSLLKSPGFTAVAVLTLALGTGANTAIFTTVDAALLRDPPFRDPTRLVVLWEQNRALDKVREPVSAADFRDWQAESHSFTDMAAWVSWGHTLTAITLLLFVVASLACTVPARRAARVDPNIALRSE